MGDDKLEQLILMPRRGFRARELRLSVHAAPFLESLHALARDKLLLPKGSILPFACRILDSIRGDGPKLVELSRGDIPALRAAYPGLDLVPLVYYAPAAAPRPTAAAPSAVAIRAPAANVISIRIVDAATHQGVAGAEISAFTNFATRDGETIYSAADGRAQFSLLGAGPVALERFYVFPPLAGYWGHFKSNFLLTDGLTIALQPIDMTKSDSLRHFYGNSAPTAGAGVKVGIIDGGVGPHDDIVCEGDVDNGAGHGTHVAGIIAGRGSAPTGIRGLAPGVDLRSYRVFGVFGGLASNFTMSKAIDTAVRDHKCDLINMSMFLNDAADDPAVRGALEDAREAGTLPIRLREMLSVNRSHTRRAMRCASQCQRSVAPILFRPIQLRRPMWLLRSATTRRTTLRLSRIPESEIDVAAPGAGVVSTVPGGYGVMSGTSMACPAVTGIAARLLAGNAEVLQMSRGPERSARMAQLVMSAASSLGFAAELQGAGLPSPQGEA